MFGESAVTIEYVKSGLQNFMLEISYCMILHIWVAQLKLIVIKTLIENNQGYTTIQNIQIKSWR